MQIIAPLLLFAHSYSQTTNEFEKVFGRSANCLIDYSIDFRDLSAIITHDTIFQVKSFKVSVVTNERRGVVNITSDSYSTLTANFKVNKLRRRLFFVASCNNDCNARLIARRSLLNRLSIHYKYADRSHQRFIRIEYNLSERCIKVIHITIGKYEGIVTYRLDVRKKGNELTKRESTEKYKPERLPLEEGKIIMEDLFYIKIVPNINDILNVLQLPR